MSTLMPMRARTPYPLLAKQLAPGLKDLGQKGWEDANRADVHSRGVPFYNVLCAASWEQSYRMRDEVVDRG